MNDMTGASKEKLVADFRMVVADAEELLRLTAGQAGEKMGELRERATANLVVAKEKLAEAEAALLERTKQVARVTDDYVHDHPWRAIGAAAGVGLIIGLLIGRR